MPGEDEQAEETAPQPVEVRFRAFAADGREAAAEVLPLQHAIPPPPRLSAPFFGHAGYRPGDKGSVIVTATGVKHGAVKFVVERAAGSGWEPAGELAADFVLGSASAV